MSLHPDITTDVMVTILQQERDNSLRIARDEVLHLRERATRLQSLLEAYSNQPVTERPADVLVRELELFHTNRVERAVERAFRSLRLSYEII